MTNNFYQSYVNNILTKDDYIVNNILPSLYNLYDYVVIYFDGNKWKLVLLDIMTSYPILYDTYQNNEKTYDITIALCPISLRSVVFKGKFKIKTYDNTIMLLTDDNNNILPIDLGQKLNTNNIMLSNRRSEIKIMILKEALIYTSDPLFITTDKKYVKNNTYYNDMLNYNNEIIPDGLIHPKTLVYIIQYKSIKKDEKKYSIIISKNYKNNIVSGYNFKNDGYISYLAEFQTKIINRDGFIFPCLWYIAKLSYPNSRIVYII